MKLPEVNANWFDLVGLGLVVIGVIRGRLRGISLEMLPLLQWLLIVFVGAHTYEPLGRFLHAACQLKLTYCNIAVYVFEAVLLKWAFTVLTHATSDKLLTANAFGKGEHFLGMFAGAARFGCMLIVCLALLHAFYTPDLAKRPRRETDPLTFFSSEARLQDVFSRSLLGPVVRERLGGLLIKPESSLSGAAPKGRAETLREKRERLVNEAINSK